MELDPARLAAAFELVARSVRDGRADYAALGVARSNGIVATGAFGRAGRMEPEPRCSIASITKPITAVAVLQLVEEGVLSLTEALAHYLPDFAAVAGAADQAEAPAPVTAWHVLTHTSGLTDAPFGPGDIADAAALLRHVKTAPLRWPPGSAYAYASDSFYLLAELVDRLGGGYHERLETRILRPLGMTATTFDPRDDGPRPAPLRGYDLGPTAIEAFVSRWMPGGGLWSTTEDVLRFGRALLGGGSADGVRILGRAFVELMTREHTRDVVEPGNPPRRPGYGLGIALFGLGPELPAGPRAFGHSGGSGSILVVDPDHDLVVVHLRNDWGSTMELSHEAVAAVYAAVS